MTDSIKFNEYERDVAENILIEAFTEILAPMKIRITNIEVFFDDERNKEVAALFGDTDGDNAFDDIEFYYTLSKKFIEKVRGLLLDDQLY